MLLDPWVTVALASVPGFLAASIIAVRFRRRCLDLQLEIVDLETQTKNARQTRDAVGQVIGAMTQRVIGPIQNIIGFGRVLEQSASVSDAQREIAKAISDSGRQLEQTLSDALGVSLSATGSLTLEESEIDVVELMASVARSVRSRCVREQLKLSLLVGPDLPRSVRTDPVKLRYVLLNMINEVISTTDAGGAVTLSAARLITPTVGSNDVRLTFEACGGESAPAVHPGSPRAREAAQRTSQVVKDHGKDQLTLAEQFVHVMGGSIVALEAPGGGLNLHAELTAQTDEPQLAEVIELDEFQQGVVNQVEESFFGDAITEQERLVDLVLLERYAQ